MGGNKAVFYFDVEIKRRELLSRLTVAALLAERGHHVFIGERATIDSIKKIIPKATIVRKSVRSNSIDILNELKDCGCKIVNMEEEGVLIGSLEEYIGVDMPPDAVDVPHKHILWGETQIETLQERYPAAAKKFSNDGNPRLNLWEHQYYGYYDRLSSKLTKELGDFVLMSSNFAVYTNKRLVKEMFMLTGFLSSDSNVSINEKNYKTVKFLYNEFVKAAKEISSKNIKVVFRPHPADSIEKIKEDFSGYNNVIVSSEYDVAPWIIASRAVIHNCCTTGLEAVFMKKNTIAYTPNSVSQYKLNEVNKIAKNASNVDELMECIYSSVEFHYSKIDLGGYLNCRSEIEDIVDSLEKIQVKASFDIKKSRVSSISYKLSGLMYTNLRKIKDFFILDKIKKREVGTLRKKFPVTDSKELIDYLLCIYNSGLLQKTVNCSPVGKNIFYLYCE